MELKKKPLEYKNKRAVERFGVKVKLSLLSLSQNIILKDICKELQRQKKNSGAANWALCC